jgi:hypothetical protein
VFTYANIGSLKVKFQYIESKVSCLSFIIYFPRPLSDTVHQSIGTREGNQFYSCHTCKLRQYIFKVTFVVLLVVS